MVSKTDLQQGNLGARQRNSSNYYYENLDRITKWKLHLDLLPFNPQTEMELEACFEDAAFKITANGGTAAVTLQVMQLLTDASSIRVFPIYNT